MTIKDRARQAIMAVLLGLFDGYSSTINLFGRASPSSHSYQVHGNIQGMVISLIFLLPRSLVLLYH
ncbi:hypothetical protein MU448_00075 [Streptococcus sp. O1]|uniref:hypothetical protein n=1 Tax=Streptococcus sp. O1 TaxID=2928735 RepID=UPI00211B0A90|nr:hypothetical protein [Streptococcus sp. O1]MCQ9212892.1 hypothetical protein [Streptococcus sp. O1]